LNTFFALLDFGRRDEERRAKDEGEGRRAKNEERRTKDDGGRRTDDKGRKGRGRFTTGSDSKKGIGDAGNWLSQKFFKNMSTKYVVSTIDSAVGGTYKMMV